MKCLIVLSAVLAVVVAKPGYLGAGLVAPGLAVRGLAAAPIAVAAVPQPPANIVIGPGGVPLDTPEVAAARGAHLVAVAQTRARDAIVNSAPILAAPAAIAAPAIAAPAIAAPAISYAVGGPALIGGIAPSIAALGPAVAGAPGALAAAAHLQAKAALLG